MAYLLYSNSTSATGKELAAALGIACGSKPPSKKQNVLIRWGSTEQVSEKPGRVLNNRNAILLATNKLESLKHLKAAGITVPEVWTRGDQVKFPALARKINHSQGADIILCLQKQDIRRAINRKRSYFVEYIPTDREYRAHVFRGNIFRVNQKLLQEKEQWVPHIRNVTNGYIFAKPREAMGNAAETAVRKAVESIGLDFGAVDLVIGDNGNPYILEINTGPSLVEVGVEAYAEIMKPLL